jgi:hypothetical protein
MTNSYLKKTILISFLGHLAFFPLFNLTFKRTAIKTDYAPLSFLGQILPAYELKNNPQDPKTKKPAWNTKIEKVFLDKTNNRDLKFSASPYHLKPGVNLAFNQDKSSITPNPYVFGDLPRRKESVLMFYPLLPYQLQLYFKDRQTVHIELMFSIMTTGRRKSVAVRRKVSSGNLEADLLSSRYIGHYLFIQQSRFIPDNWQTVKIDLSTQGAR